MPFASAADGTQLHFTDWGNRTPGRFCWCTASAAVRPCGTARSRGWWTAGLRCVTFDRRGHGRSDVPGRGYDLDTLAGDIAAVARQLNLVDVVLVGHSLGGAEAIRYLAAHADGRVAGLVLSAPSAPALRRGPGNPDGIDPDVFRQARQAMRRRRRRGGRSPIERGGLPRPGSRRLRAAERRDPAPAGGPAAARSCWPPSTPTPRPTCGPTWPPSTCRPSSSRATPTRTTRSS